MEKVSIEELDYGYEERLKVLAEVAAYAAFDEYRENPNYYSGENMVRAYAATGTPISELADSVAGFLAENPTEGLLKLVLTYPNLKELFE